ncbi:MAG: crossover junction endodeoxyribonuclease RuvC [Solirubrobacteraceae bacterium]
MIVLGIDPGLAHTGFGVVRGDGSRLAALDGGVIETSSRAAGEDRLARILVEIGGILDRHEPSAVAIEDLYFGQNVRSAFAVGQARGVVMAAAGARGIACHAYTPQQVKSAVCGSGRAGKAQVGRMVAALLSLAEPAASDHAADALAVAICHVNRAPMAAAVVSSAKVVRA